MRVGAMLIRRRLRVALVDDSLSPFRPASASYVEDGLGVARSRGFRGVLDRLLVRPQRPAAVDQAAGLERLGERERAREVVLVAVRALQLQLAQPRGGQVGLQLAGHADEDDAPACARQRRGLFEAGSASHTVQYTVEASEQHLAALMTD